MRVAISVRVAKAGQKRIDVGRSAFARLGDERQVGGKRIVVRRARRHFIGERRRESIGWQRLAARSLAGLRVDRRDLGLPVGGDLFDLRLVVADPLEVAERHQLQAVAGRADLRIDLKSTLQLAVVELAERSIAGQRQVPRPEVELFRGERRGRVAEIGCKPRDQRDRQDEREVRADETQDETHRCACPFIRPERRPSRRGAYFARSERPLPPRREARNR